MKQKNKTYPYYDLDTSFLGAPVKLCFDKESFNQILKDHNIQTKETALNLGQAETHYFTQDKNGLIVVVYDLDDLDSDTDFSNTISVIVHESVHVFHRIMDWVGEESPGEEIQAYLTEWIAKQTLKGLVTEKAKRNALREANRVKVEKASERKRGRKLQVDLNNQRGERPNSLLEQTSLSGGTKDGDGKTKL